MEAIQNLLQIDGKQNSDAGITPESYDKMRCDWYNQSRGSLTGYDCPKCRNKGSIAYLQDGVEMHRICECMAIRQNQSNITQSGLAETIRTKTFDAYQCKEDWQTALKENVMHYAEKNRPQWLYIGGQSGAGKTHLCTAVCGVLLQRGLQVRYEIWQTIFRDLSQFATRQERFQQLTQAQVLYIDDFLKPIGGNVSDTNPKEISIAFELLNERYTRNMVTIISSERIFRDLLAADKALAGRIKERCNGYLFAITRSDEKNWRLR